jgi:hypothetical protein
MNARHRLLAISAAAALSASARAGDIFVSCMDEFVYRVSGQSTVMVPTICMDIRAMAADKEMLYLADSSGGLYRIDTFNGMSIQTVVTMLPMPAQSLAAGGGTLFVGSNDGNLRRLDPATGQVLNTWNIFSDLRAMSLSGGTVIAGGMNTLIYKGDANTGGYAMIAACGGQVTALATNGTLVLAGTPQGIVYRYSISGMYDGTFELPNVVISGMAMDRDVLVVVDMAGVLRRVNPTSGAVLETRALPAPATSVAVTNGCRADINGDGVLNVADFGSFLSHYGAASMRADMNDDTRLNIADFTAFLQAFAFGCD